MAERPDYSEENRHLSSKPKSVFHPEKIQFYDSNPARHSYLNLPFSKLATKKHYGSNKKNSKSNAFIEIEN